MIVQWKRIDASHYVADWQGMHLALEYNATNDTRWSVVVNWEHARQRWNAAVTAMDEVDELMRIELERMRAKTGLNLLAREARQEMKARSKAKRLVPVLPYTGMRPDYRAEGAANARA